MSLTIADAAAPQESGSQAAGSSDQDMQAAGLAIRLRRNSRISLSLMVLATIAFVAAMFFARAFFVPLLIGILTSYALRSPVDGLERLRIPRAVGAALVLACLAGGAGWIAYSLGGETAAMVGKLPDAARKLRQTLSSVRSSVPTALQSVQEAASELQRAASDAAHKPGTRPAPAPVPVPDSGAWLRDAMVVQSALLMSVAAQTSIVLLLAYFLLASGDHFRRKLVQFVGPSLSAKKDVLHILGQIDVQVQRYLLVTLITNVTVGVGTWLAFRAMGLEEAGVWGVVAGVLHFIPYLGSVLLAIAVAIAAFVQFGSLLQALSVAAVSILVGGLIAMLFMTWLQSRFARVNAAVLFIALLFFGWLWGISGLLLGAPLLAIAKVICDRVDALKPVGELLGR